MAANDQRRGKSLRVEGFIIFIKLKGQINCLPDDLDFIVCGQSAASLLGLTSIRSPLQIYQKPPEDYVPDETVLYLNRSTLDNIPCKTLKDGVRCTTIEQTLYDLLSSTVPCSGQVLPEMIATLIAEDEEERLNLSEIENKVKDMGVAEQYEFFKKQAYDFLEHWG